MFKITQYHISKMHCVHESIIIHTRTLHQFLLEPTVVSGVIMIVAIYTLCLKSTIIIRIISKRDVACSYGPSPKQSSWDHSTESVSFKEPSFR